MNKKRKQSIVHIFLTVCGILFLLTSCVKEKQYRIKMQMMKSCNVPASKEEFSALRKSGLIVVGEHFHLQTDENGWIDTIISAKRPGDYRLAGPSFTAIDGFSLTHKKDFGKAYVKEHRLSLLFNIHFQKEYTEEDTLIIKGWENQSFVDSAENYPVYANLKIPGPFPTNIVETLDLYPFYPTSSFDEITNENIKFKSTIYVQMNAWEKPQEITLTYRNDDVCNENYLPINVVVN